MDATRRAAGWEGRAVPQAERQVQCWRDLAGNKAMVGAGCVHSPGWSPGWRRREPSPIPARLEGDEGAWEVGGAAAEATAPGSWHPGKHAAVAGVSVGRRQSPLLTVWVLPAPDPGPGMSPWQASVSPASHWARSSSQGPPEPRAAQGDSAGARARSPTMSWAWPFWKEPPESPLPSSCRSTTRHFTASWTWGRAEWSTAVPDCGLVSRR